MKRFHIHIAVENLPESIDFYSKMFATAPTTERSDYAKWLLDDPGLNFAISSRGHASGINHLGFQVDTQEELETLKHLAETASDDKVLDQGKTSCCYSNSEKHWTIDPQGLAWEHFHTLSEAIDFGDESSAQTGACCIPVRGSEQDNAQSKSQCCIPKSETGTATSTPCCD